VPLPLQKSYMKCVPAYSSLVKILCILTTAALQHNTATPVYEQELLQVTAIPARSTSAQLHNGIK
jgi:hypothetical protein